MPFFRRRHERNLSTTSSGKSSLFEFDESSSSRANSELDLSETSQPAYARCSYTDVLSKSSYNDEVASILLRTKSRLSKTLHDLLHDHGALAYFIQYLDSCNMGQLVKFWLDAESFRASTITRAQTCRQQNRLQAHDTKLRTENESAHAVVEGEPNKDDNEISGASTSNNMCNGSTCSLSPTHEISSPKCTHRVDSIDESISSKLAKSIQKDAVSIYQKYISQDSNHPIMVTDSMRSNIIAKICSEDGEVDASCFVEAQENVIDNLNKDYFPGFLNSVFHCKHQVDLLTSTTVYLADILYNDTALFYFTEFMELEGARNLIEFWLMTHNFQEQHLADQKAETFYGSVAQDDAMVLYDKYFSLQAISPIGFSDEIRFEIEHNICSEPGPDPSCFRKPMALVLNLMESTYLPQFLRSQLFYKYLSELANTIQGGRLLYGRKKRSGSESSGSEHSAHSSSTNTLLAVDSSRPGTSGNAPSKLLKNINDQDMRIDTGKFNNPSDLWKRDLAGKLEMGKVNKFGQFETQFIPQPDAKESKITKAVKKFVNKEDSEKDEEMAWQVAEMIVKDVCNMTMNDEFS